MVLGRISQVWCSRNCLVLEGSFNYIPNVQTVLCSNTHFPSPRKQGSPKKWKKFYIGAASLGREIVLTIVQGKAAWLIQMEIALRCKLEFFVFR